MFGFLALIHAANVITNPLISAMLSETIEYAELKSGRRCAAIAFSGQTFTGKLAWAIAGGISGTLLIWLGLSTEYSADSSNDGWAVYLYISGTNLGQHNAYYYHDTVQLHRR